MLCAIMIYCIIICCCIIMAMWCGCMPFCDPDIIICCICYICCICICIRGFIPANYCWD